MRRPPFQRGDRIRLLHSADDASPLAPGATGVVTEVVAIDAGWHVSVRWDPPDDTRVLSLVIPPDAAETV